MNSPYSQGAVNVFAGNGKAGSRDGVGQNQVLIVSWVLLLIREGHALRLRKRQPHGSEDHFSR